MRFNSKEHIQTYVDTGKFPAIHSPLVSLAVEHLNGRRGLDLCCSHGLLGEQLHKRHGFYMVGVDADAKSVALAKDNSITMDIYQIKLKAETFPVIFKLIQEKMLDVLIARRCFPELFGENLQLGKSFFAELSKSGVKEIALEGRVQTLKATNPLASLDGEIALAINYYSVKIRQGNTAILQLR